MNIDNPQADAAARGDVSGAAGGGTAGRVATGDTSVASSNLDGAPDTSTVDNAKSQAESRTRSASGVDDAVSARDRAQGRVDSETGNAEGTARAAVDVQAHADAQAAPVTQVADDAESNVRAQTKPVDDAQGRVDDGRARVDSERARVDDGVSTAEDAYARPAEKGAEIAVDSVGATEGIRSQQDAVDRGTSMAEERARSTVDVQASVDAEVSTGTGDATAVSDKAKV